MARPLRIEVAGGFYHVISHGNGRLWLFRDDTTRIQFLINLGISAYKYNVIVHAFVLMTTHLHMLIETRMPNISHFMLKLLSDYGLFYNRLYNRKGSVFRSRYTSNLIQENQYYLTVVRYLFNNPVKAKLVKRPELYRWSSLYYLVHPHLLKKELRWYNPTHLLQMIGGHRRLSDLMMPATVDVPIVYRTFIGDKKWAQTIIEKNKKKISDEVSGSRELKQANLDINRVLNIASQVYNISHADIVKRGNKYVWKMVVYFLYRYVPFNTAEVARLFGVSKWVIAQSVHRMEARGLTKKERTEITRLKRKMSNVKT
jgi:REP element-mobilizing transposase RayT